MVNTIPNHHWRHPAAVWLVVLIVVFVSEYAVMLILPWLLPGHASWILEAAVDAVSLTVIVAPVMWWTVVRPLQAVIRLRTRFLTDLFARIEADRRQTAHELHDGVGQSISLLVSGIRSARASLPDAQAVCRCDRLLDLAQTAVKDVKRLALGLRPSLLDDLGLAPALERLIADVRETHDMELTLDAVGLSGVRLPEPVETAVFRIVQEGLANVVRHAGARSAWVGVHQRHGVICVEVGDDGCGLELSNGKSQEAGHLGLLGMRERATLLGGKFTIDSSPGRGTRITAIIPVGG